MAAPTQKPQGRKPRKAHTSQPAPKEAPPPQNALDRFFVLLAQGTSVATELRAGLATFLTMAYIMFVNPAILEKAHGCRRGVRRDLPCGRGGLYHHGALRQLPDRPRSGHGAQRLFRLHSRARARRQLAIRSGLRVHFRRALLCAVALALARLADRRSPDEFEARHRRRHRTASDSSS